MNTSHAIAINIQTNGYPDETKWFLSRAVGLTPLDDVPLQVGDGWELVDSGNLTEKFGLSLGYHDNLLSETLYHVEVQDSYGNGFTDGSIVVTNSTAVVWSMNGTGFANTAGVFI
jgi:hypothetical protein